MNILILGHNGMLGHNLRFPDQDFKDFIRSFNGDYIINCIGAIPQRTNKFEVNSELPIWLSDNITCKIIHPGTDCEMDVDGYGMSKKVARDYIINNSKNTKIIKSSIIGPELNSNYSLFNWFLSSTRDVNGYTNAMWNGITTYEWAKQCLKLIDNWNNYDTETIIASKCISKYTLLQTINLVFNKKINILPVQEGHFKCLQGDMTVLDIESQLIELKDYYYDNKC